MKNFAGINFHESPILKNFAGIFFCESSFLGVKKGIYFRKFGQISRNSRNFLPAKISSLKVVEYKLSKSVNALSTGTPKLPETLDTIIVRMDPIHTRNIRNKDQLYSKKRKYGNRKTATKVSTPKNLQRLSNLFKNNKESQSQLFTNGSQMDALVALSILNQTCSS